MERRYPRIRFQKRLDELKKDVDEMGQATIKSYQDAVSSFVNYDKELVKKVIQANKDIHLMNYDLEHKAMSVIASEQPVAGDLRFIEASLKVGSHLKRIAGLAANITEVARHIKNEEIPV